MKILLYTSYGPNVKTPEMQEIMKRSEFPKNRTGEIISFVESHAIVKKENECDRREWNRLLSDGHTIIKLVRDNIKLEPVYYIWFKEINAPESFFIAEVDTTRPWTITDYDGSEYIQYLDYDVADAGLNYCELRN